jgi:hypothetical protein
MILRPRASFPGPSRRPTWTLAALAVLLALGGCAPGTANLTKLLVDATDDFHDGLRWQKHEIVAEHLRGAAKEAFLRHAEAADGALRISEIELLRTQLGAGGKKAVLRFRYHWYRTSEVTVQRSVVAIHWRFEGKTWLVEKIEPGGGPEFPLFAPAPPASRPGRRPAATAPPGSRP